MSKKVRYGISSAMVLMNFVLYMVYKYFIGADGTDFLIWMAIFTGWYMTDMVLDKIDKLKKDAGQGNS